MPRNQHRSQPFRQIQQQRQCAEPFRTGARHVGCPNIATTDGSDVFLAKETHQQVTERDGPKQISQGENGKGLNHGRRV